MNEDAVAKLVITSYGGSEYEIPLLGETLRIGRDKDSDIPLDDEFASRQHALIERRADKFYVVDSGSTNGTYVGDQVVRGEHRLRRW